MSRGWAGKGSTRQWRAIRARVLHRDGHRCQIAAPGCVGHATHVDHIVPKSRGGSDDMSNLRGSCSACNMSRGNAVLDPRPQPRTAWL